MKNKWLRVALSAFLLILPFSAVAHATSNTDQIVIIQPYKIHLYNNIIKQLYADDKNSQSSDITTRLLADSNIFMGKPYYLGALGEGPAGVFDKDPLYRTDEFDCQTFVSTVLALVESNNFDQFRAHILDIRYAGGVPTYLRRNHFTSVDWNINNQKQDYIVDYTKVLFPKSYKTAVALINKPSWFQHLKANNLKQFKKLTPAETKDLKTKLRALGNETKAEMSYLNYVPLTALYGKNGKPIAKMFARIPSGVIIEIVRPNWPIKHLIGTNLNISHLGFGVRINGVLYFREASSIEHKVVDIPLDKYLANYLSSKTVKGINIQKINL